MLCELQKGTRENGNISSAQSRIGTHLQTTRHTRIHTQTATTLESSYLITIIEKEAFRLLIDRLKNEGIINPKKRKKRSTEVVLCIHVKVGAGRNNNATNAAS